MTNEEYQARLKEIEESEAETSEKIAHAQCCLEVHAGDPAFENVLESYRDVLGKWRHVWQLTQETKLFLIWAHDEELKGRAEEELTFGAFVRETGALLETNKRVTTFRQDRVF
jgi:hypothetical protein